jgi:hypothetical protein
VSVAREYVCTQCGYVGRPTRVTKGSIAIELVLWLFLIIPGLVYSIWRLTSRFDACPACKQPTMIPTDTPVGRKLTGKA